MTNQLTMPPFPDLVSLSFYTNPVPAKQPTSSGMSLALMPSSPTRTQVELILAICFGVQELRVPGGYARLGLKRGELKLRLENGAIARESVRLLAPFSYIRGTETEPVWGFEATVEPILCEQLDRITVGTIDVTDQPVQGVATFEVQGHRDFHFEGEGLWRQDITPNKQALLEQEFFRRFIAPRFMPHLRRVEICYE